MKSVAELDAVRERARAKMALRSGYGRVRVAVAMGTCGIASGARNVLLALVDEIEQRALLDVVVTQSGCRGLCEREPMIEVQMKDQPPVTYGDLTPGKARAIVAQHLEQGVVIEEWVVTHGARPEPTGG
jgi:NADP-reducing hydrogenase subunit HndB